MTNHQNLRDSANRYHEFSLLDSEIKYLSGKMDFSVDEIFSAIQEVGIDREEIIEYIRDRRDRA
jgi:hypothetical protein